MLQRVLPLLCLAIAFPPDRARATDSDDVLQTEAAFSNAKIHNDVKALDRLLADAFIEINQWGAARNKQILLQLFRTFKIASLTSSNVAVRVSGDTATVAGERIESGQERYLFLETFIRRDGAWKVFSAVETFRNEPHTGMIVGRGPEGSHPITGRIFGGVMGMEEVDWLTRPERERQEKPEEAIAALGIAPGATVADIGAGVGYYSLRLAKAVGPAGKVYANEIQPEMIERLKANLAGHAISNVVPVLGKADDPMLPDHAIDLALIVDAYHEFSQPQKMLDRIRVALKPGGRLAIIERRREDLDLQFNALHRMSLADLKAEVEAEGFALDQVLETLPAQHLVIFKRK